MRLGLLEIVIIIAVIIAIAVIARIIRTGRNIARENTESSVDIAIKPADESTNRTRRFFRKAGIALVLAGVILLLAGVGMFKWALQSYMWSFVIVIIGILLAFLSKKR